MISKKFVMLTSTGVLLLGGITSGYTQDTRQELDPPDTIVQDLHNRNEAEKPGDDDDVDVPDILIWDIDIAGP